MRFHCVPVEYTALTEESKKNSIVSELKAS